MEQVQGATVLDTMSPQARALYDALVAKLPELGAVRIEPKKTSVHLCNRYGFAGVHPRRDYINVEIHLAEALDSPRISKVEQASANRFHHTVPVRTAEEVDTELLGWLHDAYRLKA